MFARALGAVWAGGSNERPPEPLDTALLFAPASDLVPTALAAIVPGGTVVCGEIHISDIRHAPAGHGSLEGAERLLARVQDQLNREPLAHTTS